MQNELLVIGTAALPISELRGAIPLGLAFGFSPLKTYLLAVLGNGAIVLPLFLFLVYGSGWLMEKSEWCNKVLHWVFERTRRRHAYTTNSMSLLALAAFVAVPLPMTGAWTATILAFLINMSARKALTAILVGVASAGLIVLVLSLGIKSLW
jgi:uncharacterized membrane protein